MVNEVELYFDTINDFPYSDYVAMCNREGREPKEDKSKDFKNWNTDMKSIVYRMFLVRLKASEVAINMVNIKSKSETMQMPLRDFLINIFTNNTKFRFVREADPDKLSLCVIDKNKKQTTYKITFVDDSISYEHIF